MAKADLTNAMALATSLLNASDGYLAPADGVRHAPEEIGELCFHGDEQTYLACASTVGHFARSSLLFRSADLAHGDRIPEHVGDLGDVLIRRAAGDVEYVVGTPASYDEIIAYRKNPGGIYGPLPHNAPGSILSAHFYLSEEAYIFYTGEAAQVELCRYERGTALQSPAIYQSAVVAYALGMLPMKDGDDPGMAAYFMGIAQSMLAAIRGEAKALPDLTAYKRAA